MAHHRQLGDNGWEVDRCPRCHHNRVPGAAHKRVFCIDRRHGGQVFGDMVDTLECMVITEFGGGHAVYREVHNVGET